MKIAALTKMWYDVKRVRQRTHVVNNRFLRRAAAYIRGIARRSIKHKADADKASQPGSSPYDHFGLRNTILYSVENETAYIGPRHIRNGIDNVARVHEFGGYRRVKAIDKDLWRGVHIDQVAPVTIYHAAKRDQVIRRERQRDPKTGLPVVWIRIRTKRQAEHATRLYRRFARAHAPVRLMRYPMRPYMVPALKRSLPVLPKFWKDAIK